MQLGLAWICFFPSFCSRLFSFSFYVARSSLVTPLFCCPLIHLKALEIGIGDGGPLVMHALFFFSLSRPPLVFPRFFQALSVSYYFISGPLETKEGANQIGKNDRDLPNVGTLL